MHRAGLEPERVSARITLALRPARQMVLECAAAVLARKVKSTLWPEHGLAGVAPATREY
jgi:hypothetical protein